MTYLPTLSLVALGLASAAGPAGAGRMQIPELLPEHQEQLSARRLRDARDDAARAEQLRLDAQRQQDALRRGTGDGGGGLPGGERHRVGNYRIDCLDCNFTGLVLRPVKINSSGTVAANETTTGQGYVIAGGTLTAAPVVAGATFSTVSDINDHGHLAGVQAMAGSGNRGYLWRYGTINMIDGPNGGAASPRAINAADQVTGSAYGASGAYGAFLYRSGALTQLPLPPGHSYAWGTGINVAGHVVGSSYTGGTYADPDAWRYADGNLTVLSPQFVSTYANAVNDLDEVAGSVDSYAAYWSASGRLQILNTLPNFSTGTATAINVHGVVVGILAGNNSAAWPRIAFMWDGRTVYDLNALIQGGTTSGWTLNEATSINDVGVIVGVGMLDGVTHAFMATPLKR
ncbi:MAG TPA: hypothetical protein VF453_06235 [Burkholderiaceae bacterium]